MLQIEITRDSSLKIESGSLCRVLNLPMVENYGSILDSEIQEDGDLSDFYLVSRHKLPVGLKVSHSKVVLLGMYSYVDNSELDNKYLFCLRQELEDPSFLRYAAFRISCIGKYLRYYKNDSNLVEKLSLTSIWSSHVELLRGVFENYLVGDYVPPFSKSNEVTQN